MKRVNKSDLEALRNSGLFDEKWYLEQYPDVKMLGMDPLEHYLWVGAKIGRNPSQKFGTTNYLNLHNDVAAANVNPLFHYVRWGQKEGRFLNMEGERSDLREAQEVIFISQGPYKIRRQYKDFDWKRHERFLGFVDAIYKNDANSFDSTSITVVMPTFNRAEEISRAIESVRSQTHSNWNLIVVDDGSVDNTQEVVESFRSDRRVQYVLVDHIGVSGARNTGISLATGKYISYLDSDNTWDKDFLRSMVVFLETQQLDAAYSAIHALDDQGNTVCYRGDVFVWSACKSANYVDLNPFMHRRDLAFAAEGEILFDTSLRRVVDWDFILRLTAEARVSYAPFVGVNYYDGEGGARITRTEYQNGEMPAIIEAVRVKHSHRNPAHNCLDTGAGMILTSPSIFEECGDGEQYRLRFFPDYTVTNAYQNLLYGPFNGYDTSAGSIDECLKLILERSSNQKDKVIFHVHWLSPIFAPAKDESEAKMLVDAFLDKARLFIALGGQLVWTVHNVVSHEAKYLGEELRLSRGIAKLANWIHVHHAAVVDATKNYYELPLGKVVVAEHGNYIGSLPDETTRELARSEIGIPLEDNVFLFLGQIRGYKGIDELITAFSAVSRERSDCWLILAGKVLGIAVSELEEKLSTLPNVIFKPGYVPDDKMQLYLKSADVMVLPYRKVLTSGSVFLALSFGLPVICPRAGLLSNIVSDGENGLMYTSGDGDGLLEAMRRFLRCGSHATRQMGARALSTAKSFRWEDTAATLRRHIEGAAFGHVLETKFGDSRRIWFVRGDVEQMRGKRCIAIVLHYQNVEDTRNCIRSILQQSSDIGIVLISNSESLDDIRALSAEFAEVLSVQSEDNIGYAAANNFGIWVCRQIQSEFFWIINPDIIVPENYYRLLVKRVENCLEHDFFGSTIVPVYEPSKAMFCGGEVRLDEGARPGHLHMGCPLGELPNEPFECDYLTGANIFGRSRILDSVGYMPEEYFLYFEETHWFTEMTLQKKTRRPLIIPDLIVQNHKRSENGNIPSKYYIYYFIRNSLVFGSRFSRVQWDICERAARKFADAWQKKIAARAPSQLHDYEKLIQKAFADGRAGRTGRVAGL